MSCGDNGFREALLLRDGAGEGRLLPVLDSVEGHIKGGHGWSCDNSFREAVPLFDGAGEGLLVKNKRARVGLAAAFLPVPCCWNILQSIFSRPCLILYGVLSLSFLFECSSGLSSSSSMAVTLDVGL